MFLSSQTRIGRNRGCDVRRMDYRSLRFDRLEERRLLAADLVAFGPIFESGDLQDFVGVDELLGDLRPHSSNRIELQGEGELSGSSSQFAWIEFRGDAVVPELAAGFTIGSVGLSSQESNSNYNWFVNDNRFEIVDSKLQLKTDVSLEFQNESSLSLSIQAVNRHSGHAYYYPMLLRVLSSEHHSLQIHLESEYSIDEKEPGAVLGSVTLSGEYASDSVVLSVNDSRLEIVDSQLKLKDDAQLVRAELEYFDVIVTARDIQHGVEIAKATRVKVEGDPTPYHNDLNPGDVDGDGALSPLDTLLIVNYLNLYGPGVYIPDAETAGLSLDVNADGTISPLDALIVINLLNQRHDTGPMAPAPAPGGSGAVGEGPESNVPPVNSSEPEGEGEYGLTMEVWLDPDDPEVASAMQQAELWITAWQNWMPSSDELATAKKKFS